MKRFASILAFIGILTLTGIQLTPAIAPFFAKDGQSIEICTLQGIKIITFDADGNASEEEREHDSTSDHCPLCMVRSTALLSPDGSLITAPLFIVVESGGVEYTNAAITSLTHSLYRPRDPPYFSA